MSVAMISPEETCVDSKEKVYSAMLDILECIVHYVKFPQTRDDEETAGMFKQAEWVIERAHRLQEANERLILAAPEMREILKLCMKKIHSYSDIYRRIENVLMDELLGEAGEILSFAREAKIRAVLDKIDGKEVQS